MGEEKCVRCGKVKCWHKEILEDYKKRMEYEMEKAEHEAKSVIRGEQEGGDENV